MVREDLPERLPCSMSSRRPRAWGVPGTWQAHLPRSLPRTEGRECPREGNGPQVEEVRGQGKVDTAWAGHMQLSACLEGKAK